MQQNYPESPEEKPKKSQADQSIAHLRCSKCLRDDVLHFNPSKFMFECTGCGSDFLNPYAVGPWDKRIAAIEKIEDDVVSSYIVETREADELEPNENYMEFIKLEHKGENLNNREIPPDDFFPDWMLPTQATEQKVEVSQEAE